MRVAFFVGPFPSLSETFILNQITGLIDRGHRVDIYGRSSRDERHHDAVDAYSLMEQTRTMPRFPSNLAWRVITAAGLLGRMGLRDSRVLQTLNLSRYGRLAGSLRLLYASEPHIRARSATSSAPTYDVAHCHFGQNGLTAVALREIGLLRARKVLTTFHGHDVYVDVPRYSEKVRRLLFEKGDGFTVNSTFTRQNVRRLGGAGRSIKILPVGLDVNRFSFQARHRCGDEPVRILTVGRLVEKKGIEYAIRALARLKNTISFEYRVVGGGPLRDELEQLARELGVGQSVTFLGAEPHEVVRRQYQWAHIFTLPSVTASDGDREGQGLVLQEAQACGLPLVVTRHNGFPDGVKEGESAFLVPERSEEELAGALRDMITSELAWAEMGQAGRTFVEENYDIEVLNDRLVDIYHEL